MLEVEEKPAEKTESTQESNPDECTLRFEGNAKVNLVNLVEDASDDAWETLINVPESVMFNDKQLALIGDTRAF